jgi:N-ethylmaleimide reductase
MKKILTAYSKNNFGLKNHIVMAPMTRSRAINNLPNDLMATYYSQPRVQGSSLPKEPRLCPKL